MTRTPVEDKRATRLHVVKRTAIGQVFNGAVLKAESRNKLKRTDDGTMVEIINKNTGRPSQELVVTCITLPGTTAPAGIEDQEEVPEPGSVVRLILKGKAFGDWITAKKSLPDGTVAVGDLVTQTTASAQVYDAQGKPSGPEITNQVEVDKARQKGRTVGIYGPITLREPAPGSEWTEKAMEAYKSMQAPIESRTVIEDDPWASSEELDDDPNRPPTIPRSEWAKLSPETKTIIASSDKPPF